MSERYIAQALREAILRRAQECCEYCRHQAAFSTDPFSIEHIVPASRGGSDTLDNLALSCQSCNNYKHTRTEARDPDTGNLAPLYHPRQHRWSDHFAWNEDTTRLVGLTPTGRATIVWLRLNRDGVVNLRWALSQLGLHPPVEQDE